MALGIKPDPFFTQTNCHRCGKPLVARTMSWFTEEVICMDCSDKEKIIKKALREQAFPDMEGCGFIPQKGVHYE